GCHRVEPWNEAHKSPSKDASSPQETSSPARFAVGASWVSRVRTPTRMTRTSLARPRYQQSVQLYPSQEHRLRLPEGVARPLDVVLEAPLLESAYRHHTKNPLRFRLPRLRTTRTTQVHLLPPTPHPGTTSTLALTQLLAPN